MTAATNIPSPPPSTALPRCFFLSLLLAPLLTLTACRFHVGGESSVEAENHHLRQEVRSLESRALAAERERDEARLKLNAADPSGALDAAPLLTRLEIDPDSVLDAKLVAHIYLIPRDGRDRFLQLVGTLSLSITDAAGSQLAALSLSPTQLRDAYRTSPFGTHYLLELPLPSRADPMQIKAVFTDAASQRTTSAEAPLKVLE